MTGIKTTENQAVHKPVLLQETIKNLRVQKGSWYVDGTFGFGGHSREILRLGGKVIGIDQDSETIRTDRQVFNNELVDGTLLLIQGNFRTLQDIVESQGIKPKGVVLDLGFSSWQLDQSGRGFSFLKNETLDMRMDPDVQAVRAADLVNGLYEKELAKLIASYGEDPLAAVIAKNIVRARKTKRIETTFELADLIRDVYQHYYRARSSKDPATKTFQALRIAVNDEMNALREGLEGALNILEEGGRSAVITFHGLEDRTVKKTYQDWVSKDKGILPFKKPILPGEDEISVNPRSHSAKLRIFEKRT